jgi:ABC-type transporter Mla subunit MlaD
MADTVHANLDHLDRLKRAIGDSEKEIQEALKKLQRTLDQTDWRDSQRTAFEAQLKQAASSVGQTTKKIEELNPILQREIDALKKYLGR